MIVYAVVGALAALVGLVAAFHVVFGEEEVQRVCDDAPTLEVSGTAIEAGVELAVEVAVDFGLEFVAALAG